ncbi:MAG: hypothetical protein JW929_03040 [Anaerolineales bacterium]|nr:hypothetical protein [Anaerolineales bacterium]
MKKALFLFPAAMIYLVSVSCSNPITSYFSTRTAVMQTATATMWTPTPTNTPTNTPTFTPTLTPTPDFLFADDFEDPDSGWMEDEDDYALLEYSDGGYRMKIKTDYLIAWSFVPGEEDYGDVRIEVEVEKIGGPKSTEFGIMARFVDRNNFYLFAMTADGYAIIEKKEDGEYSGISGDEFEEVDGIDPNGVNQVSVVCRGEELELYVNGNLVLSATDDSFEEGQVALAVGTFDIAGADVLFDNMFIRQA